MSEPPQSWYDEDHSELYEGGSDMSEKLDPSDAISELEAMVEERESMINRQQEEIEQLTKAIYGRGEVPLDQRRKIDPVEYQNTRYMLVSAHNHVVDELEREIERLKERLSKAEHDVRQADQLCHAAEEQLSSVLEGRKEL